MNRNAITATAGSAEIDPAEQPASRKQRLERLVDEHWRDIYRYLCGMVGPNEAEDLTQAAYSRAFANLHQLRQPEKSGSWLLSIAINEARRHLRERARESDAPVTSAVDVGSDQDRDLDVRRTLGYMPADDREMLLLVGVLDYTPPEAGAMLRLSESAAYKRWQRARHRFRVAFEGDKS